MAGAPVDPKELKPGYRTLDPVSILKVVDANNKTLYEFKQPDQAQVVTPQLAYLLSDVLNDNVARTPGFGSNSVLKLSRPAAVKTGTTSDWRDNWTVGYTPDYTVGVWVGNADNAEMEHISGVMGAAPIWREVMEKIHQTLPVRWYTEPPGMVRVEVCATSGLLPTPYCPERVKELFIAGTEPKSFDNIWQPFRIHKPTGKLATVYSPPDQVEEKVFPIYPPEAADWGAREQHPATAHRVRHLESFHCLRRRCGNHRARAVLVHRRHRHHHRQRAARQSGRRIGWRTARDSIQPSGHKSAAIIPIAWTMDFWNSGMCPHSMGYTRSS
jgi:membrane carboxypeptidase/penicillin-binding protein PbpC